jgi:hypothetical protein
MRRRYFIIGIAGSAATWPQSEKFTKKLMAARSGNSASSNFMGQVFKWLAAGRRMRCIQCLKLLGRERQ